MNNREKLTSSSLSRRSMLPPSGGAQMPPFYVEPLDIQDSANGEVRNFIDYARLLLHRKYTLIGTAIVGLAGGFAVSAVQTPMFRARTAIEIQSMAESDALYRMVDGDWRGNGAGGATVTAESYLETQLHMLDSNSFQRRVEEKMAGAPRAESTFQMSRPRRLLSLIGIKGEAPPAGTPPPVNYESRVLENTRIVELTADSPDPEYAADYVNTMAKEFIEYNRELQSEAAQRTLTWLTDQMASMRFKVDAARAKLEDYSRSSGLQYETERPTAEKEKLRDLEKNLEAVRLDRIQAQSAYEAAVDQAQHDQLVDDRLIALEAELVRKRSDLDLLEQRYTPQHAEVKRLATEIVAIERILNQQKEGVLGTLRRAADAARLRETRLEEAVNAQSPIVSDVARKGAEYNTLRTDLERNQKLYEDLLQKATEVSLSTAMRSSSQIRIVDPAEPPLAPYRPSTNKLMAMGLATSLFCGIGLVLITDKCDRRIRSPRETESVLSMGIPELAAVPHHTELSRAVPGKRNFLSWVRLGPKPAQAKYTDLIHYKDRSAQVAESFRDAIASILSSVGEHKTATRILVTSPSHGDGKSTVVANLGHGLADLGYSVLIVDGDLRKPSLNEFADVGNSWGLSSLVTDSADLDTLPSEALFQATPVDRLSVLTTGPGPKNVFRVLHSSRTTALFERLSKEFDFILVDTPPLLQFSDARLLGRLVDYAIVVVKAHESKRDDALEVVRRLLYDNIPVMGTILNHWNQKANAYSPYYQYADGKL